MTRRLRIAVYYNVGWGGGRRWLYEVVARLSDRHDLDLYCIDQLSIGIQYPDVAEFAQKAHVQEFHDLPRLPGNLLKPLNLPAVVADLYRFDRASKRLAALIDGQKYDLLFASIGGYTEAPLPLRHALTPSVYYCHEPMRILYEPEVDRPYDRKPIISDMRRRWHHLFYGGTMRRWDREGTRRASVVIANSKYTAGYARRAYGVHPWVNHPGVDVEAFHPGDEPRGRFVLMVGQMIAWKGYDWAVRTMAAIPAERRPRLIIVCNQTYGPERRYLEQLAREGGVTMEILERIPDVEVERLFRTASVVLYTPNLEPFGLAAIEAMASGTPVVAVREAGPIETVVDGVTGYLRERDARQLGDAVLQLLDDDALREQMGRAAREHVLANFTWDRSVDELEMQLGRAADGERTGKDD
jgi:glycosyltransferase involved in cell wall biosynthesis